MRDRGHLPVDGGDNIRVGVADQGAHLAGGEIENGAVIRIVNETSLGAFDDDFLEGRPIAGQVFVGGGPEGRLIVQRNGVFRNIVHGTFPKR